MKENIYSYANNHFKRAGFPRKKSGATMSFVAGAVVLLFVVGGAFIYFAEIFGGTAQTNNANDSGTLAAAAAINSCSLTLAQASDPTIIPPAFANYGVDSNGNFPAGFNSQGQAVNSAGQVITQLYYTPNSYNKCASITLLADMLAAKDGSTTAINGANSLNDALAKFSLALADDIKNSSLLSSRFSELANSNSTNLLPNGLFGSQHTVSLQNMKVGCYTPEQQPSANIYLPSNVSSQFPQAWLQDIESGAKASNGDPLLIGGKPINTSLFSPSLKGTITFIPITTTTTAHLISSTAFDSGYTATSSGITTSSTGSSSSTSSANPPYPYNSVQALSNTGGSSSSSASSSGNANGTGTTVPQSGNSPTSGSGTSLSMSALSSAVIGNSGSGNTTTNGGPGPGIPATTPYGYVCVINGNTGQDFAQLMSGITPSGYSNIPLNSSTNLAFDADYHVNRNSNDSLFDIFSWNDGTKYIAVATDTHNNTLQNIRNYPGYPNCNLSAAFEKAGSQQDDPPTTNYGGLVDNLALNPNTIPILDNPPHTNIPFATNTTSNASTPVMPFIWACKETDTSLAWVMRIFGSWAEYNNSYVANPTAKQQKELDSLNRDPAKDPIVLLHQYYLSLHDTKNADTYKGKTAPSLYKNGQGATYQLHEGRATGCHMRRMTLADALNIRGVYLINDSEKNYQPEHPAWADAIIPCICANYGFPYLPQWLGATKKTFSPIEYAKAQVACIFGGVGIYTSPVVVPSAPRYIYLPMAAYNRKHGPTNPLNQKLSSGMKDFIGSPNGGFAAYTWPNIPSPSTSPFLSIDSSDNSQDVLVHHPWNSVASVNAFEQVASPMQYLYDINIMINNGKFIPDDQLNYNIQLIMNNLLAAVQLMNPNHTMQDLVKALSQTNLDVGQKYYLYDNNGTLVLSANPPLIVGTSGNADSVNSVIQYFTSYTITGGWVKDDAKASPKKSALKSLVDTAASGSERGDDNVHDCPYRGVAAYPGNPNTSGNIYAEDMAQWTSGTGASNGNYGTLNFFESVGPSMQFSSIN